MLLRAPIFHQHITILPSPLFQSRPLIPLLIFAYHLQHSPRFRMSPCLWTTESVQLLFKLQSVVPREDPVASDEYRSVSGMLFFSDFLKFIHKLSFIENYCGSFQWHLKIFRCQFLYQTMVIRDFVEYVPDEYREQVIEYTVKQKVP